MMITALYAVTIPPSNHLIVIHSNRLPRRLNISPIIWQDYNTELGISYPNLNNAFAVNCAGLAVGCLIFIPFALKYGRRPVYIVSTAITFITAIWQALLRDLPNMMATQAISGMSGAVCDVVVQMTVCDMGLIFRFKRLWANT